MASIGAREGEFGLQIAPMLDVLFVLLLFFMVAAGSLKVETSLTTPLPGTKASPIIPVHLSIGATGAVDLNGASYDPVSQDGLFNTIERLEEMRAADPNLSVIISPNPSVRQQRVVDALNACREAGIKNVAFGSPE